MAWRKSIDRDNLHPGLVRVMDDTLDRLAKAGEPFKVYSGLRTFEQQAALYAKGRTAGGKIVTKARPGQSMHNYGLAVDLAPFNMLTEKEGDLWWPDPDEREGEVWFHLEKHLAEAAWAIDQEEDDGVDYEWGGRWRFRDVPHCQVRVTLRELLTGFYPEAPVEWLVHAHTTFLFGTGWMDRRVQYLLNELGYKAGPVDGEIGPRTKEAIVKAGGMTITEGFVENLVRRRFGVK